MARKSIDAYIQEALQAATFAADSVMPNERATGVASTPMRYPRAVPAEPNSLNEAAHQAAVNKLMAASGGKIKLVSGKRSTQRQTQLWEQALRKYGSPERARKWVAPPGRSRHESGLASDLGGDLALAAKLAGQFGLYRPMAHEPWHFELKGSR